MYCVGMREQFPDQPLSPADPKITNLLTDEQIDASWGLGPAEGALADFLDMDLGKTQGAARLGTLSRIAGQEAAAEILELLSRANRDNAEGLRAVGLRYFSR